MDWRPFRLLNERELAHALDAVRGALAGWSQEWMPAVALGDVRCEAADGLSATPFGESAPWLGAGGADGPRAWVCVPESVRAALTRQLFGEPGHRSEGKSNLLPAVLEAALHAMLARLVDAGAEGPGERSAATASHPPDQVWARGSGAIAGEARLGEITLGFVLAQAWVRKVLAPLARARRQLPAPVDPRLCLESCRARLSVWAGSAAIEIGVLQTLAPGDVVKLDLRIDRPLRVDVEAKDGGRGVYLGFAGGRKAVQFGPNP